MYSLRQPTVLPFRMVKPILSPRAVLSSIPSLFSRSTSKISTRQAWFIARRQLQQQRCCHSMGVTRGGLRMGRDEGRIGSGISSGSGSGNEEGVGARTWGKGQQQRRNYKTIGEQKARYKSGVRCTIFPPSPSDPEASQCPPSPDFSSHSPRSSS